jgi:hypothetical protein
MKFVAASRAVDPPTKVEYEVDILAIKKLNFQDWKK